MFARVLLALAALSSTMAATAQTTQVQSSRAPLSAGEHMPVLNGARLWYRVAGTTSGTPVVFLAGGPGGNSFEFASIVGPAMERGNRMVYFDQRGTGRSERPLSGDYQLSTLVQDIEALRGHLGVSRLALVAHSFGAILALEYAARFPANVSAMVLAGPAWNAPLSCRERVGHLQVAAPRAYQRLISKGDPEESEVCDAIFRAVGGADWEQYNNASMFPRPLSLARQKAAVAASGLANSGEMQRALFRAGLLQYQFTGAARVTAPALIIAGKEDHAIGLQSQQALARALPRGRLIAYENAGHWMFIDEPERFARDATAHFASMR